MNSNAAFSKWMLEVFDHPVTAPEWYWNGDVCETDFLVDLAANGEQSATFLAELFENPDELLSKFTEAQIGQGLWYLIDMSCSDFARIAFNDSSVSLDARLRLLRSFVPLFERLVARHCVEKLGHLSETNEPLNMICYMWWDVLAVSGNRKNPASAEFDLEVLKTLARLLEIPHDACRESALHGLGHWFLEYPETAKIIDDFLRCTPHLRPELIAYARNARTGNIQ